MSKAQDYICRYAEQADKGYCYCEYEGQDKVFCIFSDGTERHLTIDLYCNIIDATTGKVIALSNLPQTLDKLPINAEPTSWTKKPDISTTARRR